METNTYLPTDVLLYVHFGEHFWLYSSTNPCWRLWSHSAGFNQEIFTNSAKSANKPKASQTGATWPFKRNNRPDKKTQNTTPTVYSELHLFNMVWKILKVIIVITVRPQCRHEKTNTCIQYMLNQRIQYFEVRGLMTYFGKYLWHELIYYYQVRWTD